MRETSITELSPESIALLQELIEINVDSGKGFVQAAERIENRDIAAYFRRCGERRVEFAGELQRIVGLNGEEPERAGTALGSAHRWWLGVRAKVQSGDEQAVLAEAERGEDAIKDKYEEVVESTAGSPVSATISRQYASVLQDHDTIRDMRDARA